MVLKEVRNINGLDCKTPTELSEEIIRKIKQRTLGIETRIIEPKFLRGDCVHITKGVFKGFEGIVDLFNASDDEVCVKVYFLGTDVVIKTDKEDLEKIGGVGNGKIS